MEVREALAKLLARHHNFQLVCRSEYAVAPETYIGGEFIVFRKRLMSRAHASADPVSSPMQDSTFTLSPFPCIKLANIEARTSLHNI